MNKKLVALPIALTALIFMGEGCEPPAAAQTPTEQQQVEATHAKQVVAVPIPELNNSLERINISKRLQTFDNPNKVSYIYLTSYGKVMAFYTIKGKVTSGGKRLTSTQQQVASENYRYSSGAANLSLVMEAPELDGSYGSSAPYIFFWTTDGTYVQWSGEYMLADQPLKLTTQPELVREIK